MPADSLFSCGLDEQTIQSVPPTDPLVTARLIFIGFPDELTRQDLPSWNPQLKSELDDFMRKMSRGVQGFAFDVITNPDAPGKAWIAPWPASHYGIRYWEVNQDVMQAVYNRYLQQGVNIWTGVEFVFTVIYRDVLGAGGWSGLGVSSTVTGYAGPGSTQRLFDDTNLPVNDLRQLNWVEWVCAQEYGHNVAGIGLFHSPHSETWNLPVVNYGRYDGMSGNASLRYTQGNTPFQAIWLVQTGWVPETVISSDIRGLHVPEIRGQSAMVYRVAAPSPSGTAQYFVLANHQGSGSSVYDAKYGGNGLLIWHVLLDQPWPTRDPRSAFAWDLESGDGKFANGWPGGVASGAADPVSGTDRLEFDGAWRGSSGDFFNNSLGAAPGQPVHTDFSRTTNPNTNAYSAASYPSPQSVQTSIAFENIHKDQASSDMIVDVYVDPKQYVFYPNGGEYIPKGVTSGAAWTQRPKAGISGVDILLSQDGGVTYSMLASGQPNTGAYVWSPSVVGSQYRFKVRSYDALANASDESDANFNVWGVDEPTIWTVVSYSCDSPTITFDVFWATSIETDGSDVLEVYAPNQGTPSSQSAASQGTQHRVIWHGSCQANATVPWTYRVKSTKGSGVSVSALKTKLVTQCASCPPPCNPPCELE